MEIEIGDEILIRVKVVDVNNNKYGSFVRVEVPGIAQESTPLAKTVKFSIPHKDQPKIIVSKPDNEIVDQAFILMR